MNGIEINIDPVIGYIWGVEIRWYTLAIIAGIIAAVIISIFEGKRKGIPPESIISLVPWVLIGGIIGARLFHIVDHWGYYMANPALIFQLQHGGLAIWGALVGGTVAAIAYTRISRVQFWKLADALVPGLLVAQIIGRFGCIVNGDAYGGFTTLPWGFIYTNPNAMIPANYVGIPTHPYPVYDMLWNLFVLGLVLVFRSRFKQDGVILSSYLGLYAIGRFILTFFRQENVLFWGLQEAQVVSVFILIGATAVLLYFWRRQKRALAMNSALSQ
jgi:phosphatidylglycerol:prolipoprotein diacylglycerol transferase